MWGNVGGREEGRKMASDQLTEEAKSYSMNNKSESKTRLYFVWFEVWFIKMSIAM